MRVHLIDGTYELFRAHYSKRPPHLSLAGMPVKATAGLMASLFALLDDPAEAVTHLAVAFDNPIRSFRNDLFAGYKSDEGIEPELRAQFDLAERAVKAMGIVVWSMGPFEADDAIGTAAARFASEQVQVRILSPDKDFGQCLRGQEVVQVMRVQKQIVDEDSFRKTRLIAPASVPDYLALVGDTADGIPGLPGFGEKTAAILLHEYAKLESIPKLALHWKAGVRGAQTLADTLRARKEDALLYRHLATLALDVPLAETLDDLQWRGVDRPAFEMFCDELSLRTLRERAQTSPRVDG